ncbi:MAG TPA: RecQ family zinc-binding domain-containing protein, partial [Thermoguttaceae bacterium]|nr:RecQ family zinc-binding domain-containing protein [Thermoguttaceae bacterium]
DVSTYDLSQRHDMRPLVVRTLLTYLELEGIISATSPFYSMYKFQPQKTSQEILGQFDPARAEFLRSIFRHASKGKKWFSLEAEQTGRAIGQPRERIVAAIGYLEESGDLIVQASGVRQGYRRERMPDDVPQLCATLFERFQTREDNDIERIRSVLALAEHEGCLTQDLLSYFGERRDACGHCGRCEGEAAEPLPPANYASPDPSQATTIDRLRSEGHPSLATPRQLARFLCGLSSPATSRARLRGHRTFGMFASVPFHEVLSFIENGK